MAFQFEDKLRAKATAFILQLQDCGIAVDSEPAMFRDYMVKLTIRNVGAFNIHYKPKSDQFTLSLGELRDAGVSAAIQSYWQDPVEVTTPNASQTEYQAYVDGSYLEGTVGYGAVILQHGKEIERFAGTVSSDTEMHQVGGELTATLRVVDWCLEHNTPAIEIYFDYEGIQKWATGEWKANKAATQRYQQRMRSLSIEIIWKKVKSHSGDRWNDVVDGLAKQGANSRSQAAASQSSIVDPLADLERQALAFVDYLESQGQHADFERILNGQCARIRVNGGYFDLYNTAKKPMSPHVHGMNESLKQDVEQRWNVFHFGSKQQSTEKPETLFGAVEYYLDVFRRYRHLAFDFSVLADAILEAAPDLNPYEQLPSDNYDALEQIYISLKSDQ